MMQGKSFAGRVMLGVAGCMASAVLYAAPVAVATYDFNDGTLNAKEVGAPALVAIDPMGLNGFVTDVVFGESRTVYQFGGNAMPVDQGGLALDTTGLLSGKAYSVDMVFAFDHDSSSWMRILDASNRSSDNGFYVDPSDRLEIYPVNNGPTLWTAGEYHRVTLTNDGLGHVTAYLDGIFQFDLITNVMDFETYAGANPDNILTFFADNLVGGGQREWVSGKVASIRVYDFEIDPVAAVPEPGMLFLTGLGVVSLFCRRRKLLSR